METLSLIEDLHINIHTLKTRIQELETEAIKESHRLAEANLRAAQMESQHKQAAEIATAATKELAAKSEKIQELEAMLESVGAGGVSAQRVTQGKDHIEHPIEMVAAPVVLPEPVAAQVRKVMLAINEEQLKKAKSHNTYIVGVIADKIEDGTLFDNGIYRRREIAEIVRNLLSTVTEFQVAAQDMELKLGNRRVTIHAAEPEIVRAK